MRMWMLDPRILCRNHLLGEHNELHMLIGCIQKGKSINGYTYEGLVDPSSIKARHEELVREMLRRGYQHNSPVPDLPSNLVSVEIDTGRNLKDLVGRCSSCRFRVENPSAQISARI